MTASFKYLIVFLTFVKAILFLGISDPFSPAVDAVVVVVVFIPGLRFVMTLFTIPRRNYQFNRYHNDIA